MRLHLSVLHGGHLGEERLVDFSDRFRRERRAGLIRHPAQDLLFSAGRAGRRMEARLDGADLAYHSGPFVQQFHDLIVDVVDAQPLGTQCARELGLILGEQA